MSRVNGFQQPLSSKQIFLIAWLFINQAFTVYVLISSFNNQLLNHVISIYLPISNISTLIGLSAAHSFLFVLTLIFGSNLTASDPTDRVIYYQRMIKDDYEK